MLFDEDEMNSVEAISGHRNLSHIYLNYQQGHLNA